MLQISEFQFSSMAHALPGKMPQDGLLIRWIDADGKVHDKESDNDKYVELGDKYWSNSVVELQQ